ncbi:MAG TPA: nucleotidyltransferase domain-containing protein [Actinocrinis sp.]|nr:nucleotidyltransferase domain-containing protein [Actinocrinis sp.]
MNPAPDPADVQHQVHQWLCQTLGQQADAAFIYGSVAAGMATPASDIDCVIFTTRNLGHGHQSRIRADFATLQQRLGYTPDLSYPIETFTVDQCQRSLASRETLLQVLALSAPGAENNFLQSDDAEILRALLGRRLTVRPSPHLDDLTLRADTFAAAIGNQTAWLHLLGVKHPRPLLHARIEGP